VRPRALSGRLVPAALLAAGLLLGGVALALLLEGRSEHVATPSSTATAPTTGGQQPPAPAPTLAGAQIGDLQAASVSSFAATVSWRTGAETTGWVAAGPPQEEPALWWRAGRPAREHSVALGGLAFSTPYRVWVTSIAPDGRRDRQTIDLTTSGPPASPAAAVGGGAVTLDGQPFFPLMVWGQCPATYETSLRAGVNLFADNPCGGLQPQLEALAGRAFSAAVAGGDTAQGPGLIGVFYPDEADGRGLRGPSLPVVGEGSGVRFLTLTNHFYSGAAPLPQGRRMYPGLVAKADAVGFDLYPLQGWCRPERLADVYLAQQELARLAAGKPTFQWIEAAGMRCPDGATAVTPQTVRAEAWLAVAGGAGGLGFFPPASWTGDVGGALAEVTSAIRYLSPALLAPAAPVTVAPARGPVKAGARAYGGALYVIAVNAGFAPARATIRLPGLAGRPLTVFGEARTVPSEGDVFADAFAPLAAHVYIAAPAGS